MCHNRVQRKLLESKRDDVTGECRRLHIEKLSGLYLSPNIIQMIKSRRLRWVVYVARMGERKGAYRVW